MTELPVTELPVTDGAVPLDGNLVLEESFPEYAQGLAARRGRAADVASPYVGLVEPRPALLDPRESHAIIVSATRLEALGACPLRYPHRLQRVKLRVQRPGPSASRCWRATVASISVESRRQKLAKPTKGIGRK